MVDAHKKGIGMIADGGSVATLAETVDEVSAHCAMGIGDGAVVEVAADDDGTATGGWRM